MAPDLSVCRALLDRDPVRYLDMTEPVRRGAGRVLSADEDGALVAVETEGEGGTLYTLCAQSEDAARRLCALIPPHPSYVTVHEALSFPVLREKFGYQAMNPCWQVAYLESTPLPLPVLPFALRPLTLDDLPQVREHYHLTGEDYLAALLSQGRMTGAFDGDSLAGFIGLHEEGTVGLLEVFPSYRRRGLATLLQAHMTNRELALGHVPYGQVFEGNGPSLALQRSLGFECSKGRMFWPKF